MLVPVTISAVFCPPASICSSITEHGKENHTYDIPPRCWAPMLQQRAREGIRKAIAAKQCCHKVSYGTSAGAIEASQEKELNAFITVEKADQDAQSNRPDDVLFGVYSISIVGLYRNLLTVT